MVAPSRVRRRLPNAPPRSDQAVVLIAGTAWDGQRLSDQNLAVELARHAPVLYVDPPVSAVAAARDPVVRRRLRDTRLRDTSVRTAATGVIRVTPVVPGGKERPGGHELTTMLMRRAVHRAVDRLGCSLRAVIAVNPTEYVLRAMRELMLTGFDGT